MADNILTLEEVAQILRVSIPTVRKLIRQGKLKAFYVGNQVRIRRADLDEYISSQYA